MAGLPCLRGNFLVALLMAVAFWSLPTVSFAASDDAKPKGSDESAPAESIEFKPYTGPPIFLDEPEAPPKPALVGKNVDTDKYPDGKVRLEREIAKYSDNHLEADGYYREYYPNGQKFAEGQYKSGRQEGTWTFWYDDGKVNRTVIYKNGQPDGTWEVHRADGTLAAKRSYKNGKRDGTWTIFDDAGKQPLREEIYKDGVVDGTWKVWFPSGQLKTQIGFKDGKREGPSIEWDEKGTKRGEINYSEDKPHGKAMLIGADGRKVEREFDHGKLVKESDAK